MPDEPLLRAKARDAILNGRLPTRKADRMFGGPGGGESCAVCGKAVTRDRLVLELEYRRHGARPELDIYHLHTRCYAAWEFERIKVEGTGEPDLPFG